LVRDNNLSLGLSARYYLPLSDKWTLFGNLSGPGYQFGSTTRKEFQQSGQNRFEVTSRYNGYTIGAFLGFGAAYFITPRIGIEASIGSIGYGFSNLKIENEPTFGTAYESE
jgi:hypothetical protein